MPPRKEYKTITAIVRVIDAKTNNVDAEVIRNIDGLERREWLEKHLIKTTMWAMMNGKYVETINKVDDD